MTSPLIEAADALAAAAEALRRAAAEEHAAAPTRLLSVHEAAATLSIGRSALYALIGSGQLRSISIGRRRLVPADALADYLESAS